MNCPNCEGNNIRVKETRSYRDPNHGFYYVERRRTCLDCEINFKTIEVNADAWASIINGEHLSDENEVTFGA